jgi:hypothetical protein
MTLHSSRYRQFLEKIIPWLILVLLSVYSYAFFFQAPYPGFDLNRNEVAEIFVPTSSESLQVGDQIVRVGIVSTKTFMANLRQTIFDAAEVGQNFSLIVERNGKSLQINWIYPGVTRIQVLQRLNSLWWLPFVFWIAGTATLLFIRPKDLRWRLLVAFNYLTAIWLAAGGGPSAWHIWQSAIVLRSAVWLCLPVYLHFHWVFPKPFTKIPGVIWGMLYAIGGCFALVEWFQVLPTSAYFIGFALALSGSMLLLIAHTIFQKEMRSDIWQLAIAVALVFVPPLGISAVLLLGQAPSAFVQGGSLLALPALPGAYFYAAYRRQFRGTNKGIKRLTTFYITAILVGTVLIATLAVIEAQSSLLGSTLGTGIVVTISAAIIATISFFVPPQVKMEKWT